MTTHRQLRRRSSPPSHVWSGCEGLAQQVRRSFCSPQVTASHRKEKAEDLSWTLAVHRTRPRGSPVSAGPGSPGFRRPSSTRSLTAPQSFWGDKDPLPSTVDADFLAFLAVPGKVLGEDNRYVSVDRLRSLTSPPPAVSSLGRPEPRPSVDRLLGHRLDQRQPVDGRAPRRVHAVGLSEPRPRPPPHPGRA